jgi:hypothetical protein
MTSLLAVEISVAEGILYGLLALTVVAMWVYVLIDLFRNARLSGAAKAMWLVIILLLPLVGSAIYLGVREDW